MSDLEMGTWTVGADKGLVPGPTRPPSARGSVVLRDRRWQNTSHKKGPAEPREPLEGRGRNRFGLGRRE